MYRLFVSTMFALAVAYAAPAQSFIEKVKRKALQTAENKTINKTGEAVEKGIDRSTNSTGKNRTNDKGGNKSGEAQDEAPESVAEEPNDQQTRYAAYRKFDFVPGESIIYLNDFAGERAGELPTGWNSNGSSVIVSLDRAAGQWLDLSQRSVCLTDNATSFGDNFTVEFDMIVQVDYKGWYPPTLTIGLLATGKESTTSNNLLSGPKAVKSVELNIDDLNDGANINLESYQAHSRYFHSPSVKNTDFAKWKKGIIRVSMHVQKERLRVWMNNEKVYDVPKALPVGDSFNQLFFRVAGSAYKDEQLGYYVSNIKVAKGLPDTRHKLIDEGRFSTTGILFDINSSVIRPESAGVLKEIAAVLQKHPEVTVKVIGHTDSDGDERMNQQLSEQRAKAVKDYLLSEYQIDDKRLSFEGKGELQPVADNKTAVGKAQNRRVEFVRL